MRLTQKQFAEHVGLSQQSIGALVKEGALDLKHGDIDRARLQYCAHIREIAAGRSTPNAEYDLVEERARLAHHQANIAALDEKVKAGELIPAGVVLEAWQNIFSNVRARLLAMPTALAGTCVNATREEVSASAMKIIRQALSELSENVDYH